ncbi:hypothetical protein PG993_000918 [Apiospora rasikravindrae]|uniref:Prolyl 4-hydroxylase alpha subunit domain-containing protein n=1 Tax=Apiospora rasikravindrae TaxID=990691 RepID=A0ABR1U9Y3_9PEZI
MTQAILPAFATVEQNADQMGKWDIVGLSIDQELLKVLSPGLEGATFGGFGSRVHEARPDGEYYTKAKNEGQTAEPPRNPADSIEFVDIDSDLQCEDYPLQGHVLHQEPLVMYIQSFVKPSEAAHIIETRYARPTITRLLLPRHRAISSDICRHSEPGYGPAHVEYAGKVQQDRESRRSETSTPPRDTTIRCLEQRIRNIQPWDHAGVRRGQTKKLEALSTQRYQAGGFFTLHYDYFAQPGQPDRASTLNVYLDANCTGGGTHFPLLPRPKERAWCEFIECDDAAEEADGVVFKPIPGNAIYWENLREDGTGYEQTLHQGLPIESGVKIGLNAWSWVFPRAG